MSLDLPPNLPVFSQLQSNRTKHGFTQTQYKRYERFCTTEIASFRQTIAKETDTPIDPSLPPYQVDPSSPKHPLDLSLILHQTERDLAAALRLQAFTQKEPGPKDKIPSAKTWKHMKSKMARAMKKSAILNELVHNTLKGEAAVQAQAYSAEIAGDYFVMVDNHIDATVQLSIASKLLSKYGSQWGLTDGEWAERVTQKGGYSSYLVDTFGADEPELLEVIVGDRAEAVEAALEEAAACLAAESGNGVGEGRTSEDVVTIEGLFGPVTVRMPAQSAVRKTMTRLLEQEVYSRVVRTEGLVDTLNAILISARESCTRSVWIGGLSKTNSAAPVLADSIVSDYIEPIRSKAQALSTLSTLLSDYSGRPEPRDELVLKTAATTLKALSDECCGVMATINAFLLAARFAGAIRLPARTSLGRDSAKHVMRALVRVSGFKSINPRTLEALCASRAKVGSNLAFIRLCGLHQLLCGSAVLKQHGESAKQQAGVLFSLASVKMTLEGGVEGGSACSECEASLRALVSDILSLPTLKHTLLSANMACQVTTMPEGGPSVLPPLALPKPVFFDVVPSLMVKPVVKKAKKVKKVTPAPAKTAAKVPVKADSTPVKKETKKKSWWKLGGKK
eukprot:gnl/Dysnectes_brevis/2102_a2439_1428.p1 GENE.gnl/Dysnectes_brevis/2102_a2439_1428~~gnl/Dysnectes_brevis/2102_a2439_1428.p1  ORF type:complete len:620 (-),score=174.75 gnl/Dysnectes_brevis/2102_a2439_1428:23-1882(-)